MFTLPFWISIAKGAAVAAAGAGLTYLAHASTTLDYGPLTPAIAATLAVVVNIARKFLADNEVADPTPPAATDSKE